MAIKHRIRPFGLFFWYRACFSNPDCYELALVVYFNFSSHSVSIFVHANPQIWVEKWRKSWMPLALSFLKTHRAPLRLYQTNFYVSLEKFSAFLVVLPSFVWVCEWKLALKVFSSSKSDFFKNNFSQLSKWLKTICCSKKCNTEHVLIFSTNLLPLFFHPNMISKINGK